MVSINKKRREEERRGQEEKRRRIKRGVSGAKPSEKKDKNKYVHWVRRPPAAVCLIPESARQTRVKNRGSGGGNKKGGYFNQPASYGIFPACLPIVILGYRSGGILIKTMETIFDTIGKEEKQSKERSRRNKNKVR